MVAILSNTGVLSQQVRYSAYGVPTGIPAGDTNADGSIVATPDITQMIGWIGTSEVRGDLDLDGDCDNDDMTVLTSNFAQGLGWNKLSVHPDSSLSGVKGGHRKGYCGYEHDLVNPSVMHVRHRVYFAELGRWSRRDPLGFVDGLNLYEYVESFPLISVDPMGLCRKPGSSRPPCTWGPGGGGGSGPSPAGSPECADNKYGWCHGGGTMPEGGGGGGGGPVPGPGGPCPPMAVCQGEPPSQPCSQRIAPILVALAEGQDFFGIWQPPGGTMAAVKRRIDEISPHGTGFIVRMFEEDGDIIPTTIGPPEQPPQPAVHRRVTA